MWWNRQWWMVFVMHNKLQSLHLKPVWNTPFNETVHPVYKKMFPSLHLSSLPAVTTLKSGWVGMLLLWFLIPELKNDIFKKQQLSSKLSPHGVSGGTTVYWRNSFTPSHCFQKRQFFSYLISGNRFVSPLRGIRRSGMHHNIGQWPWSTIFSMEPLTNKHTQGFDIDF